AARGPPAPRGRTEERDRGAGERPDRAGDRAHGSGALMSGRGIELPLSHDQELLVTVSLWIVEQAADWVLKRKRYHALKRDELIATGRLALMHAARRFDPALGEFERFARKRVVGAMLRAVRKAGEAASFEAAVLDASLKAADEVAGEEDPPVASRE